MYASHPKHALESSRITDRVPTGSRVEPTFGRQSLCTVGVVCRRLHCISDRRHQFFADGSALASAAHHCASALRGGASAARLVARAGKIVRRSLCNLCLQQREVRSGMVLEKHFSLGHQHVYATVLQPNDRSGTVNLPFNLITRHSPTGGLNG